MRISDWSSDVCSSDLSADASTRLFNGVLAMVGRPLIPPIPLNGCSALDNNLAYAEHIGGTFNEDSLSWRVGVDVKPAERVLLYANASRGYKAGSVPVLSGTSVDQYRSEEHTSELQSLMRISYAVFCLKKKQQQHYHRITR